MNKESYSYNKSRRTQYTFVSKGRKGAVVKIVEFMPTTVKNLFNLGFGDLLPDGTIDDTANTNNGDIGKVMTTIISIADDFTKEHPQIKIVFTGSSMNRTKLYQRILDSYYPYFSKDFIISALQEDKDGNYSEVYFERASNHKYVAFFVKRKQ